MGSVERELLVATRGLAMAKTHARLVATNDSVTAMPANDHSPAPVAAIVTPTAAPAAVAIVDDSTKSRM